MVAFSIGAIVQWISRILLSYDFEKKAKWVGAIFGGVALSAITYFIFMKGIKGTPYAGESYDLIGGLHISNFLENRYYPLSGQFCIWSLLSYILVNLLKLIFIN